MPKPVVASALAGFLVLLAVLLPLRIARAGIENSLWIDEIESFMLASHSLPVILDYTANDTNPPGYFLALKAWIRAGKLLGPAPGVLWARLLGTVFWLGLAAACWFGGRLLAGASFAAALSWAVAGSAYAAVLANDARGYAIASVALFACFILLLALHSHAETFEARPGAAARLWLLYALSASVALWTHLLSAPLVGLLALVWAITALALRRRAPGYLRLGALAHGLVLIAFLPWVLGVLSEVHSLNQSAATWMTPATWPNLFSVFSYWYPFGRAGSPDRPGWLVYNSLGAASLLVPLAVALWASRRKPPAAAGAGRPFLLLAACGFGLSIAFVVFLWTAQRLGLVTVFYAPRYPALAASFWAAGLLGLAAWAVARAGWDRRWAWLLLSPWLLCAALGQVWAIRGERCGGLAEVRQQFSLFLPRAGGPVYVMPSELIPYFQKTFGRFSLRRIEELPCALAAAGGQASVLDLNFWHALDRSRDLVARTAITTAALAGTVETRFFPEWRHDFAAYSLSSVRGDQARSFCQLGFVPASRRIPGLALAVALPEDQRYSDGWSFPEVGEGFVLHRWASSSPATVRFKGALRPGAYRLHFHGYRTAYPAAVVPMAFHVDGENEDHSVPVPAGGIDSVVAFRLASPASAPVLRVVHPVWTPRLATGSSDSRQLTVLFDYAWIETAPAS